MELQAEVIEQIYLLNHGLMWELPVDVIQSMETAVVCSSAWMSLISQTLTLLLFDRRLKVTLLNVNLIIRMSLLQQAIRIYLHQEQITSKCQ